MDALGRSHMKAIILRFVYEHSYKITRIVNKILADPNRHYSEENYNTAGRKRSVCFLVISFRGMKNNEREGQG